MSSSSKKSDNKTITKPTQSCPSCGHPIGTIAGSKEAVCPNCGFKDPCCE